MSIIKQITGGVCTGPITRGDDGLTVYGPHQRTLLRVGGGHNSIVSGDGVFAVSGSGGQAK